MAQYQETHANTKHKGVTVKFAIPLDTKQSRLSFAPENKRKRSEDGPLNTDDILKNDPSSAQSTSQFEIDCVSSVPNRGYLYRYF